MAVYIAICMLAGLLTVQLAITAGVTALFIGTPSVKAYVYSNQVRSEL
jgi:hypothetical protein